MATPGTSYIHESLALDGWNRAPEPVQPLPGQTGLFEYRPHAASDGQVELFDTGRDLPGAADLDQSVASHSCFDNETPSRNDSDAALTVGNLGNIFYRLLRTSPCETLFVTNLSRANHEERPHQG